jgi:hypothetical protein
LDGEQAIEEMRAAGEESVGSAIITAGKES